MSETVEELTKQRDALAFVIANVWFFASRGFDVDGGSVERWMELADLIGDADETPDPDRFSEMLPDALSLRLTPFGKAAMAMVRKTNAAPPEGHR